MCLGYLDSGKVWLESYELEGGKMEGVENSF